MQWKYIILGLVVLSGSFLFPQKTAKEAGGFRRGRLYGLPKGKDAKFMSYGGAGGHKVFEKKTKTIIEETTQFIHQNKNDLHRFDVYKKLLEGLGKKRRALAEETQSISFEKFGFLRSLRPTKICNSTRTPIRKRKYFEWGEDLESLVREKLQKIQKNPSYLKKLNTAEGDDGVELIQYDKDTASRYRFLLSRKKTYAHEGTAHFYVRIFFEVKVDNLWRQLTRYTVNFYHEKTSRPKHADAEFFFKVFPQLNWLKKCWHQSCTYFDKIYDRSHQKYRQILLWNKAKETPEKLKEHLAGYHWLMAHWMPFARGSAAVTEWMTQALARFHGFKLRFTNKWRSQDQKALAKLQFDFVKGYVENSTLTPLK